MCAGAAVWNGMSDAQKAPWKKLASDAAARQVDLDSRRQGQGQRGEAKRSLGAAQPRKSRRK